MENASEQNGQLQGRGTMSFEMGLNQVKPPSKISTGVNVNWQIENLVTKTALMVILIQAVQHNEKAFHEERNSWM